MVSLSDDTQADIIEAFNSTSIYLNYFSSIDTNRTNICFSSLLKLKVIVWIP